MKMSVQSKILLVFFCFLLISPMLINNKIYAESNATNIMEPNGEWSKVKERDNQDHSNQNISNLLNGKKGRELVEGRTQYSKKYLLNNNNTATVISLSPLHFEDEEGKFHDINTKLIDRTNNNKLNIPVSKQQASRNQALSKKPIEEPSYLAPQVPFNVNVSKNFNVGYSIGKEDYELSFVPLHGANVTGSVHENRIRYENPWKDTDVTLEINEIGINETILLKSSNSPKTFSYRITEELSNDFKFGALAIQPTWLIDAEGTYRDVSQTLRKENGIHYLDLVVDDEGLLYPLSMYPSVYAEPISMAYASQYVEFYPNSRHDSKITYSYLLNIGVENYFTDNIEYMYSSVGLIKFELESYGLSSDSVIHKAEVHFVNNMSFLNPPEMVTQDWGPYVQTASTGMSLEFMIDAWLNGTPNYGMAFTSNRLPFTYNFGSAMLYVEYHHGEDFSPPTAPENLISIDKSANSVTLRWNASTDTVGVSEYIIYNGDRIVDTTSETTYTVTGLTEGIYTFKVAALDTMGNKSESSNIIIVNTHTPTVPTKLTVSNWTNNSITLTWTASTDNLGISGYEIYDGSALMGTVNGTTTTYTLENLTGNKVYRLTIKAKNVAENLSLASNVITISIGKIQYNYVNGRLMNVTLQSTGEVINTYNYDYNGNLLSESINP